MSFQALTISLFLCASHLVSLCPSGGHGLLGKNSNDSSSVAIDANGAAEPTGDHAAEFALPVSTSSYFAPLSLSRLSLAVYARGLHGSLYEPLLIHRDTHTVVCSMPAATIAELIAQIDRIALMHSDTARMWTATGIPEVDSYAEIRIGPVVHIPQPVHARITEHVMQLLNIAAQRAQMSMQSSFAFQRDALAAAEQHQQLRDFRETWTQVLTETILAQFAQILATGSDSRLDPASSHDSGAVDPSLVAEIQHAAQNDGHARRFKAKQGRTYRVVAQFTEEPFTIEHEKETGNAKYDGYLIDIFKRAAALAQIDYTIEWWPDPDVASTVEMIRAVSNGTYDIAVGDIVVTPLRGELVHFGAPITTTGYLIATKVSDYKRPALSAMFAALSPGVWSLMFFFFLFGGVIVFFIELRPDDPRPVARRLIDTITFAFNTPWVPGFSEITLRKFWSKAFMFVWLVVIFIILTSYQANLVSFLTASRLNPPPIESINDLPNRKLGVWFDPSTDSSPWSYMANLGYTGVVPTSYTWEGTELITNKTIDAYIDFAPYLTYWVSKTCGIKAVGTEFSPADWAWAYTRTAEMDLVRLQLDKAIFNMTQTGTLPAISTEWLRNDIDCKQKDYSTIPQTPTLYADAFIQIFIIWFCGGALLMVFYSVRNALRKRKNPTSASPSKARSNSISAKGGEAGTPRGPPPPMKKTADSRPRNDSSTEHSRPPLHDKSKKSSKAV